MTKKYIATYADAKGNLKRVSERFYGDFNERIPATSENKAFLNRDGTLGRRLS